MTQEEAVALAMTVHAATGHETQVRSDGDGGEFEVSVLIARPRSGAIREEFTLSDELDWDWLRERITDA